MSLAAYVLDVITRHVQTKTMNEILAGPRLRQGPALRNREIVEMIVRGRR